VGALLAAASRPQAVHSLTLVEPMAYSVALHQEHVRRSMEQVGAYFAGNSTAPREFLGGFFQLMGVQAKLPDPPPPALDTATRLLMRCRQPWTAEIPLAGLGKAGFPTLVVSGGHSPVFESVCDVLATRLGAEREVISGAGHSVPRIGAPFNQRLESFLVDSAGCHPTSR
jgi:pimeloyl-ACP methyl ester carboxylesterase